MPTLGEAKVEGRCPFSACMSAQAVPKPPIATHDHDDHDAHDDDDDDDADGDGDDDAVT